MNNDKGHEALLADLRAIIADAEAREFHDFNNTKYAAPKMALAAALLELRQNVMSGKYDN